MNIHQAIIPAAGKGTRLLPLTRALPKEMMPIFNRPALEYILEEGYLSGIDEFCIIVTEEKRDIMQRHFHVNKQNQNHISYTLQEHPLGLGHAILMGKHILKKEDHFAIFLPDDIIDSPQPTMHTMYQLAQKYQANVIAVETVPNDKISSYGIIKPQAFLEPHVIEIDAVIEKPTPEEAPSNLAIVGRYILPFSLFDILESMVLEKSIGEIQLTPAIQILLERKERFIAYHIDGTRYDIGNILGLHAASIAFGNKYIHAYHL